MAPLGNSPGVGTGPLRRPGCCVVGRGPTTMRGTPAVPTATTITQPTLMTTTGCGWWCPIAFWRGPAVPCIKQGMGGRCPH